jgi:hypothetical protein
MDFINRKISCHGPSFRYSRLPPITAANDPAKPLISLNGGPGRTRTSNQAVMNAVWYPKIPAFIVRNQLRQIFIDRPKDAGVVVRNTRALRPLSKRQAVIGDVLGTRAKSHFGRRRKA